MSVNGSSTGHAGKPYRMAWPAEMLSRKTGPLDCPMTGGLNGTLPGSANSSAMPPFLQDLTAQLQALAALGAPLLPTSLSDDQAAPLHEHGSAACDDYGADCSAVLADPDSAIYRRVRW